VSDRLLQLLEAHQASLQDLRLEWCCDVQPSSGTGTGGTGASRPCFSEAALAGFLARCRLLRSVRLRHSAPLGTAFAQQLASSCPMLQLLVLDQCDMEQVGRLGVRAPLLWHPAEPPAPGPATTASSQHVG
jgi:hypothetical protein